MATNGVELADTSSSIHDKTQVPSTCKTTSAGCNTRTYHAAALRCTVKTRCSREYACSQSDLSSGGQRCGKAKLSKAERRLENKRKRKLTRQSPLDTARPSDAAIGTEVDAAETAAASSRIDSDGAASSPQEVHVTYEAEVEVVMNTGQYRVVRRLLAAVGLPVLQLRRTAVGCVSFEALAAAGAPIETPGDSVLLPAPLLDRLWQTVGGAEAVWKRRLAALRAKCGESSSCDGSDEDEAQRQRLRQWLLAKGLLEVGTDGCCARGCLGLS